MLDKARYIVVEGPIGAGKTSLARRLAGHLKAATMLEEAETNPFLGRFYQDRERWGMSAQLGFFFQRLDQLAAHARDIAAGSEQRVVSDFIFEKDRLFAETNLNAEEFALMVKNGMSPALAIRSATVDASELLGLSARVGTIAAGKEADIIAVAGDPTGDVRLLENVSFVMKRGKVIKLDGKPQLTAAD